MLHQLHTNLFCVYFTANLSSRRWKTFWWVFLPFLLKKQQQHTNKQPLNSVLHVLMMIYLPNVEKVLAQNLKDSSKIEWKTAENSFFYLLLFDQSKGVALSVILTLTITVGHGPPTRIYTICFLFVIIVAALTWEHSRSTSHLKLTHSPWKTLSFSVSPSINKQSVSLYCVKSRKWLLS